MAARKRVTVGCEGGALHPLWLSNLGIRMATLAGARAIWLPDHFMGFAPKWLWKPEIVPAAKLIHSMDALFDPIPLLTLAARRHPRAWIGTSVTEPIRRHPMSLAQTFATLDHISRGRAILGIGNGLRENTQPYGFSCEKRVSRLEEALAIIRKLWESRGEPVNYEGKFWQLKDAVFDLPLYKNRPPRIFVGAHYPRMLRICGRYADGWLPGQKISGEEYGARLEVIRGAAREAGRPVQNFTATQTALVAFGPSREWVIERALRNDYCVYNAMSLPASLWKELGAEHPLGEDFAGSIDIVPSRVTPEQVALARQRVVPEMFNRLYYAGRVEDILEDLRPLAAAGCSHIILADMGSAFTGRGLADLVQTARLTRALRKLEVPAAA